MHARPPQGRRAGRSGLYSGSRFSNWAIYDPYESEISALPRRLQPACLVPAGARECPVYELPLHPAFVRPFTPEDVLEALAHIPPVFLSGLRGVYLLGGTAKQERACYGDLFRYGCYGSDRVYLHAFPEVLLECHYPRPPRPHVMQDYRRAGAVWEETRDGWVCRFDRRSLRAFYLSDVLIHEVGHHADRHQLHKNDRAAERFADWFARTYGRPRPAHPAGRAAVV